MSSQLGECRTQEWISNSQVFIPLILKKPSSFFLFSLCLRSCPIKPVDYNFCLSLSQKVRVLRLPRQLTLRPKFAQCHSPEDNVSGNLSQLWLGASAVYLVVSLFTDFEHPIPTNQSITKRLLWKSCGHITYEQPTVAPDDWKVLLSQRRRWINSMVHNLGNLYSWLDYLLHPRNPGVLVLPTCSGEWTTFLGDRLVWFLESLGRRSSFMYVLR